MFLTYWTRHHRLEMTRGLCSSQYCSAAALLLFFQIDETKIVITQSFLKLEAPNFTWHSVWVLSFSITMQTLGLLAWKMIELWPLYCYFLWFGMAYCVGTVYMYYHANFGTSSFKNGSVFGPAVIDLRWIEAYILNNTAPLLLLLFFQIDEIKTVITQSVLKLEAPNFAWHYI